MCFSLRCGCQEQERFVIHRPLVRKSWARNTKHAKSCAHYVAANCERQVNPVTHLFIKRNLAPQHPHLGKSTLRHCMGMGLSLRCMQKHSKNQPVLGAKRFYKPVQQFWACSRPVLTVLHACHQKQSLRPSFGGRGVEPLEPP